MAPGPAERILVIDDDETLLKLARLMLERRGYAVDTVATGAEGLSRAEAVRPDLIVLDIVLPDIDGWTVIKRLRSSPDLLFVPVIGVDRSADFRTNIGMVNTDRPVDVDIRLVSGTGALLGSGIWHLETGSHIQINDIFTVLNVPWQTNCRVDFRVDDTWASIFAYASVIDNRSGDSVYVPVTGIGTLPVTGEM